MTFPGGTDTPILTVDPHGPDTTVTLTVTGPSGEILTPTPISTDGGATWYATPIYTATGKWVAKWDVAGTGANPTYQDLWVSRIPTPAAAVGWRPELWHVAAHIPRRTLVGAVDGSGTPRRTFDSDTLPTGAEAQIVVTGACAWVGLLTGTVDTSLYDAALECAALRAAGLIESSYPDNGDDLSNASDLLKEATQMRKDLAAANIALGVDDPATTADDLLPVWSFPAAVSYGDYDF